MTPDSPLPLLSGRHIMLFDGDCGICSWSAERALRMARRSGYRVEPYFDFSEEELATVGLDYEQCTVELKVVTKRGRVLGGAFAVNHFLWHHPPLSVIPLLIYILFPLLAVEIVLYRIVARNRHHISRRLGMTACAVRQHGTLQSQVGEMEGGDTEKGVPRHAPTDPVSTGRML